jgi:hypothetical protein
VHRGQSSRDPSANGSKLASKTPTQSKIQVGKPGVEIRGRPVVRDHHLLGKDDHVLTDGSPSDDLIFVLIIVLYEEEPLGLPCFSKIVVLQATMNIG